MAYAGWTKGTSALLLAVRAMARSEGVEEVLLAEWALSQPGLADRSSSAARAAITKGWRWVAEMEEIAATMASAGLPDGFHQAAAEIFRRSPRASTREPWTVQPRDTEPPNGPLPAQAGGPVDVVLSALTGDVATGKSLG